MDSTTKIQRNSIYKAKPSKRKKKPKTKKLSRLQRYAKKLNSFIPKSELWFRKLWKEQGMKDKLDQYNSPFGKYIPDVINRKYRYIIEIDGSVHNDPAVQFNDKLKDEYYTSRNYKVFRITAYNLNQFNSVMDLIKTIRNDS